MRPTSIKGGRSPNPRSISEQPGNPPQPIPNPPASNVSQRMILPDSMMSRRTSKSLPLHIPAEASNIGRDSLTDPPSPGMAFLAAMRYLDSVRQGRELCIYLVLEALTQIWTGYLVVLSMI